MYFPSTTYLEMLSKTEKEQVLAIQADFYRLIRQHSLDCLEWRSVAPSPVNPYIFLLGPGSLHSGLEDDGIHSGSSPPNLHPPWGLLSSFESAPGKVTLSLLMKRWEG